jgi:hypothetical protein
MLKIVILSLFLLATADTASAAPFGIDMGTKIEDLKGARSQQGGQGLYILSEVPKPHSAFERYAVTAAPKAGVCVVKGIGKTIDTNSYGTSLRSAFDNMREKLEQTYGKHEVHDLVMPDSIWKDPQYFMMALKKQDRVLAAIWEEKHKSKLGENILAVSLMVYALSNDQGYLRVEYQYKNEKDCDKELSAQEDGAL